MNRRKQIVLFIVFFVVSFATAYFKNTSSTTAPVSTPQTTRVIIPTAPPQGWIRLEGQGVAMQLPDTFIGGNIQDYVAKVSALGDKELSPQVNALMQEALKNPDQFHLLAINQANGSNQRTNVNVVKTRLSDSPMSLDAILQGSIKAYPSEVQFVESAVVKINDLQVIRMVLTMKTQSIMVQQLQYIRIDDNNDAWITNYSTSPDEFDKWLPIFEKSYQSLELLPVSS